MPGYTDSCVMDEQAASDATSSVMVALLSGQHLVHDVGYVEAGLTVSPEMIVFTADVIGRLRHFMAGMDLSQEAFALDLIDQIGPGRFLPDHRAHPAALQGVLAAHALQPPAPGRLAEEGRQGPGPTPAREDGRADGEGAARPSCPRPT